MLIVLLLALPSTWSPKKSVILVREPQAGVDGGDYRARKVPDALHICSGRDRGNEDQVPTVGRYRTGDDDKRMRSERDVAELLLQGSLASKAAFRASLEIRS